MQGTLREGCYHIPQVSKVTSKRVFCRSEKKKAGGKLLWVLFSLLT